MNDVNGEINNNRLFIRTYHLSLVGHSHDYDQILIPLLGNIRMFLDQKPITVFYGEALMIAKNTYHEFQAKDNYRFLVVNFDKSNARTSSNGLMKFLNNESSESDEYAPTHVSLDKNLLLYLAFIETQLTSMCHSTLELKMFDLLIEMFASLKTVERLDPRITTAVQEINKDITAQLTIESLAKKACLSQSQFKVNFKKQLGASPLKYITNLRMQKAQALILNTDMPISIVAQRSGYISVSAFIRRFTKVYGLTPAKLRLQQNQL